MLNDGNVGARIVRRTERSRVPWANGQGGTAEIAAGRDAGGQVRWRLSIASLAGASEFSPLPGLARVFTVVSGAGVALGPGDVAPFDSDAKTVVPEAGTSAVWVRIDGARDVPA